MKRILLTLLTASVISAGTTAQNHSFSLGAGVGFENYGRLDDDGKSVNTWYTGFVLTPDWLVGRHWGIRAGVGSAFAFRSNVTGRYERPMHSFTNISLSLTPYYEFHLNEKLFLDLGPAAGCRVRLPYMNRELSKYIMTLSAAAGVDIRAGYLICDNLNIFCDIVAQHTVYDYLFKTYYLGNTLRSGNSGVSIGLRYTFRSSAH